MGSKERGDLIDYIKFQRATAEKFGFKKDNPLRSSFPKLDDPGWYGRVAKELFGSNSKRSKGITKITSGGYHAYQQKLEEMGKKFDWD